MVHHMNDNSMFIAYSDKGITIANRAITEDEIKKVLVYKDRIR